MLTIQNRENKNKNFSDWKTPLKIWEQDIAVG